MPNTIDVAALMGCVQSEVECELRQKLKHKRSASSSPTATHPVKSKPVTGPSSPVVAIAEDGVPPSLCNSITSMGEHDCSDVGHEEDTYTHDNDNGFAIDAPENNTRVNDRPGLHATTTHSHDKGAGGDDDRVCMEGGGDEDAQLRACTATTAQAGTARKERAQSMVAATSSGATPRPLSSSTLFDVDDLMDELDSVYTDLAHYRKSITQTMSTLRKCQRKIRVRMERVKEPADRIVSPLLTPNSQVDRVQASSPNKARGGGLLKPCHISESLRSFLELPSGTQIARGEVTKYIHSYIREHNLYDEQNRQFIVPNSRLSELLDVADGERLHMFKIPQKMNPHFLYHRNHHNRNHLTTANVRGPSSSPAAMMNEHAQ